MSERFCASLPQSKLSRAQSKHTQRLLFDDPTDGRDNDDTGREMDASETSEHLIIIPVSGSVETKIRDVDTLQSPPVICGHFTAGKLSRRGHHS